MADGSRKTICPGSRRLSSAALLLAATALAQQPNPAITQIVGQISQDRIAATERKLGSFGTRFVLSPKDRPDYGIGAAQHWIFSQFKASSPRLEIFYDTEHARIPANPDAETEFTNVIALLKGASMPDRFVAVSGHYDSIAFVEKPGSGEQARIAQLKKDGLNDQQAHRWLHFFPLDEEQWTRDIDWKATARAKAPGVTDDGSGTAAVLELARVMSQYSFPKSILFIAFSGEEVGLRGSSGYAAKQKTAKAQIEALLNNDIIGSDVSGDGQRAHNWVRVYSAGPEDSISRSLARYFKEIGELYVPSMRVEAVQREDRFGRGGDHTPFSNNGYAAVRVTTPTENFANQHTATDTFANTSPAYATQVACLNAAVLASLALAPPPPQVTWNTPIGPAHRTNIPLITRGKSHYDAVLRWEPSRNAVRYAVLTRPTTSTDWGVELPIGNVTEYSRPNFSLDDTVLGVRAYDGQNNPSLVAAYVPEIRFPLPSPSTGPTYNLNYWVLAAALLISSASLAYASRVNRRATARQR